MNTEAETSELDWHVREALKGKARWRQVDVVMRVMRDLDPGQRDEVVRRLEKQGGNNHD